MVLVSDLLDYIGQIFIPLNLANMKIQKAKFVRNTVSRIKRVLNLRRNPKLAHIFVPLK